MHVDVLVRMWRDLGDAQSSLLGGETEYGVVLRLNPARYYV